MVVSTPLPETKRNEDTMNALNTMLFFADTFVDLCNETPLAKISISDIVERTGKNRKTFYYHFENKDHLIIWIFRHDLGQALKEAFPEGTLLYEAASENPLSQFPYYVMQKSGVRSLDHSMFFECFSKTLEGKRRFYTQALFDNGPGSLRNYLYDLYLPTLRNDIYLILSNRYLPDENVQFLAEFYTCAFLYYFIRRCCSQPHVTNLIGHAGPFANIIHSSLEMEIKEAQLRRNL
ncbi:MAG: TetR family transcriptional regulator [Eggerthellaceae bacterium]|jgi:AcrR family transcriptional regulator|nr:TetR family transcriptional regulator [Eggerthellaceae bacterium]MDR2715482.1 TetR family transcriptional regulator [Coriobacteriaceae bacterium]